jgi:O-antigen/teichoic acid export membrane protein
MIRNKTGINFVYNVVGMFIPVLIALVTIPFYISHLGAARYGVLSIVWLMLGYLGFLDLGLSRAATNALAKLAHASTELRARVLMTSLYLNLLLGTLGGIFLYLAGGILLRHILDFSDSMSAEVNGVFPWIACMLPLALLVGVGRGAIQSRERFLDLNVLDLSGFVLGQLLPIVAIISFGPSLAVVVPAAFIARALSVASYLGWVARLEKIDTLLIFDRHHVKELVGFGIWVTVTNIIGPILSSIDQLLVGSSLGAAAVAYYTVPMSFVSRSQILSSALAGTLFPRFSQYAPQEAMVLAKKATLSLGYGYGAICGPAIIIGGTFLKLWVGVEFASYATPVLELLLVGAWLNGLAYIPYALLQGQGRPDLVAKLHTLECLPYIALLWFLLSQFGLPGAALAWSTRVAVDAGLLFAVSRLPIHHLLRLAPAFVLITICYTITQLTTISPIQACFFAGLMFVTFVACALVFDATAWEIFRTLRARLTAVSAA